MGMAVAGAFGSTAWAASVSLDASHFLGISYEQDFDNTVSGAGNGGYDNTLTFNNTSTTLTTVPTGWATSENGGAATGNYRQGTAASSAADLYSFGAANSNSERALGSVSSNDANAANRMFGVTFVNNTGKPITSIYIQYSAERWFRPGQSNVRGTDQLDFQYSQTVGATVPTTDVFGMSNAVGAWKDAQTTLDHSVVANDTAGSGVASTKSGFLTVSGGINVPVGGTFAIRWVDSNGSLNEWGLGVDDLIVMVPEPWQPSAVAGAGLIGLLCWNQRRSRKQVVR
jgi:hypothetical protein